MNARVRPLNVLAGVFVVLTLGGCGESSEDTSSGPLEGREISRASQLEGTWLGTSEGDFIGFEFMDDGRVLATPFTAALTGLSGGVMYSYSILEGGRLSLVAPNGQTQIYGVTIAGEQMELSGFMMTSSTNTQRFRRLPRGQTIAKGIEEQQRLDAAAYQANYEALTEYLKRKDLVMVPTTPGPNAPSAIALELVPGSRGRGWYDDAPPHLDEIDASIDAADNSATQPVVHIAFGPQLDPPPQQVRGGGQIVFNSSGDMDAPRLVANVTYGGQNFELEIRRDASLHGEIVGRFEAEKERIAALRAPLLAALKDYAVIEGRSGAQVADQATSDRLILVRDPATGAFSGEGVLSFEKRVPQSGQITADVAVFGDQATLVINGLYRQYQLTLANAASGELAGAWFPTGQQNGWQSALSITEAIDAAERERRAEAQRAALRAIPPGAQYVGRAAILTESWGVPQPYVVLTVTPSGGTFNVAARYPSIDTSVTMSGQIAEALTGPALHLQNGQIEIGSQVAGILALNLLERQLQNQVWSLKVLDPDDAGSHLVGSGSGIGAIDLEPMTDAWKRRQTDVVRRALTTGAGFNAWSATWPDEPPARFQFGLDTGGALTGVVPEANRVLSLQAGQKFSGVLGDDQGVVSAELSYARGGLADYSMNWWAYVGADENVQLIGCFGQISRSRWATPCFNMLPAP